MDSTRSIYDVIVVGGGASGMLAAGHAAERGARVLLLERNARLGQKLSITGKGRCNLTNTGERDEFIENFGKNGRFLYRALTQFSNYDLVAFFTALGVSTKEERGGRVFPGSDDSETVVAALARYARECGVSVKLNARAERVAVDAATGAVAGVALAGHGRLFKAKKVILATGGLSYPRTGSTGDGYTMARKLGHTIVPLRPALVPLETIEHFPKDLQGLSLENVRAAVIRGGKKTAEEFGDMLFTHFGVSGPIILKLSGFVVECLAGGERIQLSINLKPALDDVKLENRLIREFAASGKKTLGTIMRNLLPRSLVPVILRSAAIPESRKGSQITADERKRIARLLTDFRLTVKKARPIDEAIITRGGIDLREIDPRTMESKKVRGLYFCGEIMDLDGTTGGYNLQEAFSTAYVAAEACASRDH